MKMFRFKKSDNSILYKRLVLEIIVVFLGVTAGFLLNNSNIAHKEEALEAHYLQGFLNDVEANIEAYQEYQVLDSTWLEKMRPLVKQIKARNLPADSAKVLLAAVSEIGKANVQNATYQDISNSGSLSLIQNLELRTALAAYQLRLNDGAFLDEYFYSFFKTYVTPFVMNEFDIIGGDFIQPNILETPKFTNLILGYLSMVQQRHQEYGNLIQDSKDLQKQLKAELKRF